MDVVWGFFRGDYVKNVFNEVGYDHKERFYGYGFYNTTLFDPIGREVAAEYVFTF
ncbi:hypothetical protein [Xanthomonas oryzae]|uniref:hypothetical protein n=1 Tax=Xanthomonas oryzae TaxID=347 RepID=UPI00131EB288|nr:hypothetical protein [Xanthomonas oryzae]